MWNRSIFKLTIMGFVVSALFLFTGYGFSVHRVYGQTSTPSGRQQQNVGVTSDFRHDVEEGKQQVNNDKDAQNNQSEIDNEEDEKAGDQYGDHEAINGEKSEQEIEQEVENEVEQEGEQGSQQGDEASSSANGATDGSGKSASSTERD